MYIEALPAKIGVGDGSLWQGFFTENVRYLVWTCRDPISLILWTRFSILGTRIGSLKRPKKTWPMVCWSPTKINRSKHEQYMYFEAYWKHAWTLVHFFWAARTYIFRQCITFLPNNLVHLCLCQHLQGAQVGSVCRMPLRPSDIMVSPVVEFV